MADGKRREKQEDENVDDSYFFVFVIVWLKVSSSFVAVLLKQAEGLLVELIYSSCYDFVERCCDLVVKHLSIMQKLRYEL